MKNKLGNVFFLSFSVVCGLLLLHFLPPIYVAGTPLRTVDLLVDIRKIQENQPLDTVLQISTVQERDVFVDTCKSGVTCIEDFSDSTTVAMTRFYQKIGEKDSLHRPIRIAYLGDSFIEGDILTGYLREFLQRKYGGRGVGYVSITSATSGFRPTVTHRYSGWESHISTDTCCFERSYQDLSNRYFVPHSGAWVSLKGVTKEYTTVDRATVSNCYFLSTDSISVRASINGNQVKDFQVKGSPHLQSLTVEGTIESVKWSVSKVKGRAFFYGVTMETQEGVIVDNLSLRGSSGKQLWGVSKEMLQDIARIRPYDLLILHYGPNVVSPKVHNYAYYTQGMGRVITRLKEVFPQTPILIVGAGDRAYKNSQGVLQTLPAVKYLVQYQRAMAIENRVAFWNLFEAMGGDESIVKMAQSRPSQANLDYTHINFRGGKYLAQHFFDALVYGQQQYENKMSYENDQKH